MEELAQAIRGLRTESPDRDFFVISHPITKPLYYSVSEQLEARASANTKLTLFLTTGGGDPDAGFRIARAFRHHYREHLRVAVPSWCKSAGTLVAIAANDLAIGDFGELGPLDIQVHKGTELQERSSGLDIISAIGAVTAHAKMTFHEMLKETRGMGLATKLSAEFAAQVSSAVAGPLFAQIDPMRLGELQRAMDIAFQYGDRLNAYGDNLKEGALSTLIREYPSHGFVIDRKEAKERFHRVFPLTDVEKQFVKAFWGLLQFPREVACFLPEPPQIDESGTTQGENEQDAEQQGLGSQPQGADGEQPHESRAQPDG